MNVYAVPLDRIIYGQTRNLSRKPSQSELYSKYATIIKRFLAGITGDVLRMRLKQTADVTNMSMKNFLLSKQLDIILALKDTRSLLILVYPPCEISPDLARWNTRLLCLVLRACNCLNVREQGDIIYLEKVYRRYSSNRRQNAGSGTITKKGILARREWVKVCSAVQRMVEVVNDPRLLKEVRNFICKVEMEKKTMKARVETHFRLESLLAEMVAGNPYSRYREENMTDEAKQMKRRQTKNLSLEGKQKHIQRPQSANARLTVGRNSDEICFTPKTKFRKGVSRPTTADIPHLASSQKRRIISEGIIEDNNEFTGSRKTRNTQTKCISLASKKAPDVRKRPRSATEPSKRPITPLSNKRPLSAKDCKRSNTVEQGQQAVITNAVGVNTATLRFSMLQEEKCSRSNSFMRTVRGHPEQPVTLQTEKHDKRGEKYEINARNKPLSGTNSKRANPLKRENSSIKFNVKRPVVKRKVISPKERDAKDKIIHIPTGESDFVDLGDKKYVENSGGKSRQSYVSDLIEEQMGTDKRKVFDDNMKKIANEVLVHQQIHVAAKNPLLQDKEFVDEFFSFLNENHVTKKFLRAQSTDTHQSWRLSNGKRINFSFFLAFVFRHIDSKDISMVSYVVEKMLLRMKCKHNVKTNSDDTVQDKKRGTSHTMSNLANDDTKLSVKRGQKSTGVRTLRRPINSTTDAAVMPGSSNSTKQRCTSNSRSRLEEKAPVLYRSTSITDNKCWKCLQKDVAMAACINWSNRRLCDLLISKGVPYKEEHLSAAVKANDWITLVKIVDFLKEHGNWKTCSEESKDALFLARKHRMRQMIDFLTEKGVQDERAVNHNACTPCFIT